MEFQLKLFATILLMMLSGSFVGLDCLCIPLFDVTYKDIESLNATCEGLDSCLSPRDEDTPEKYNCNCDSSCGLLGTCCVDSEYRQKYPTPLKNIECILDYRHRSFPMIHSCSPSFQGDKLVEELCKNDTKNDPFLEIPVADPTTGITYKNYYCFACNEDYGEEHLMPWNLVLKSSFDRGTRSSLPNLHYVSSRETWVMDYGEENATDIYLVYSVPEELENAMPHCFNFEIISECSSDWTDDTIRKMCMAYMALTTVLGSGYGNTLYYRNPHCAICNNQSSDKMNCPIWITGIGVGHWVEFFIGLFKLPNKPYCRDGMVYDNFAKRCREIFIQKRRRI